MNTVNLIKKKRDGEELLEEEIEFLIQGYVNGEIPDYQMSAFLMAMYFQGMSETETVALTKCMISSGDSMDLSPISGVKVDKHSTGGVGDKTTIILAPLVAAAGVPVAKMSGRGLGHTGGTIDKLESIQGFSVEMTEQQFIDQVRKINIAVCGQTGNFVPADKLIYALRDVTATVDQYALIASSVMSKKLATGSDAIVIDMKVGEGAYVPDVESARKLAAMMKSIASSMNKKLVVVITQMAQPLGRTIGNALELKEAIDILHGKGPEDVIELCLELGAYMIMFAGKAQSKKEAKEQLKELLNNGQAFDKFREFIDLQGGEISMIEKPDTLPSGHFSKEIISPSSGYIESLNARKVGVVSMNLGAGRKTKESQIDMGAGIVLHKKIGDKVEEGESLATLYTNDESSLKTGESILNAYTFTMQKPAEPPLILEVIE